MGDGERLDSSGGIEGRPHTRRVLTRAPRSRLLAAVLVFVVGAAAAVFSLTLAPPTRGDVGPGTLEVKGSWRLDGETRLQVPPLGSLSAQTHAAPLGLHGRIDALDIDRLETLIAEDRPTASLYAQAESDLRALARKFAVRALLGAALVGAVVGGLVSRLRPVLIVVGGVGGVIAVGLLLLVTWRGFDADAFAEPVYEGALERAPEMVESARRHVDDYGTVRARIGTLAAQVSDLYAMAATDPGRAGRPGEVRILHVSDIHLNPLGLEVVQELARQFDVHAVLDTGDLTSFGFPVEAEIGRAIADVPARYLFVPGNHDSEANRAALAEMPNVEVVDGVVEVRGIRILGVPDPSFTADNRTSADEARVVKEAAAGEVARRARADGAHILAVHDPVLAGSSAGSVPLVVAGHRHQRDASLERDTITFVVGSTGGTGLGSFTGDADLAFEAQVLHIGPRGCVRALDYVALDGIGGSFEIERRVFDLEPGEIGFGELVRPTCTPPAD